MANELANNWSNSSKAGTFSGINLFLKENKGKANKEAIQNEILPSTPTYQKFRSKKRPRIYNPYFVRSLQKVIQADLPHMLHPKDMFEDNEGNKYVLVVQDTFSRKIWTRSLKDKSAKMVCPKFRSILNEMKTFCKQARLVIDRGTEFLNKTFKAMLESENIDITHPSDGHAAHVERAILSLQRLLYQHIEHSYDTKLNWIIFLPKATNIMNMRYHRIIRTSPNKAELEKNKNKVNQIRSWLCTDKKHSKNKLRKK